MSRGRNSGRDQDWAGRQAEIAERRKLRTALALALVKLLPALLVAAAVIAAALLFLPVFGKPLISLVQTEERSVSDLVLAEVREMARLNTAEHHYKVVFPFDFQAPGVTEAGIVAKARKSFNKDFAESLSPDEKLWLQAVNLARANGLNPYKPDFHFLVATVVIKAGFDLSAASPDFRLATRRENGRELRSATLRLPPPVITSIEVEDPDRTSYPFPDLALSPRGWKDIASFIRGQYVSQSLRDGILDTARSKLRTWLRPLLIPAACDEIVFTEASP